MSPRPDTLLARTLLLATLVAATAGCGGAARAAAEAGPVGAAAGNDTVGSSALIPAGYGTLRQDDIAVRVGLEGVQVKAIPLDESIIRTLSPDSYRALRDLQESRRAEVASTAQRAGVQQYDLWYVSFFAIAPEARFSPMEFIVTNNGRDFRPLDLLPLTPGFGGQRLKVREVQSAIYIFDGALDPSQPLTVRVEGVQNDEWGSILRRIERERAVIRSRVQRTG